MLIQEVIDATSIMLGLWTPLCWPLSTSWHSVRPNVPSDSFVRSITSSRTLPSGPTPHISLTLTPATDQWPLWFRYREQHRRRHQFRPTNECLLRLRSRSQRRISRRLIRRLLLRELLDLGYPQTATPIITDKTTAAGVAINSIRLKRSTAMGMRFNWMLDRTRNGEYTVTWVPELDNLADYYTKARPASVDQYRRKHYVCDPARTQ